MSRLPLLRRQTLAKNVLETIDDSKDGINLLMKQTLNVETTEKTSKKILDFKSALKKIDSPAKSEVLLPQKAFSFQNSNFFGRKRTVAVGNVPETIEEINDDEHEASRKRPMFEEETQSKRPRLEPKKDNRRNKIIYADTTEMDWGALEDSRSLSISVSMKVSKLKTEQKISSLTKQKEEKENIEPMPVLELKGYLPKQALTTERLARRENQVNIGKETEGFKNYMKFSPKVETELNDEEYQIYVDNVLKRDNGKRNTIKKDLYSVDVNPVTPRKEVNISKRQWDVVIRRWRRSLHMYDDVTTEEQFKKVTSGGQAKLKTKVAKFKRKGKPVRNGFGYRKK